MRARSNIITQLQTLIDELPPSMHKSIIGASVKDYLQGEEEQKVLCAFYVDPNMPTALKSDIIRLRDQTFEPREYTFLNADYSSLKSKRLGDTTAQVFIGFYNNEVSISPTMFSANMPYKVMELNAIESVTEKAKVKHLPDAVQILAYFETLKERLIAEKQNLVKAQEKQVQKDFAEAAEEIIQRERSTNSAKKLFVAQSLTGQKKQESGTNFNDIASQAKALVMKAFMEYERGFKAKYDKSNKPNVGRYTMQVAADVVQLKGLETFYLAEKSEKLGAKISDEFLTQNISKYAQMVTTDFEADRTDVNALLSSTTKEVNALLEKNNLAPLHYTDLPRFPSHEKSVTPYMTMNKVYLGELIKKGVAEYFIALRDYTGLMMVVVGIVAPLNMIAAISENPILKKMSIAIRIGTGLLTLAMAVYGFFDLRKRIPMRRVEDHERELTKAKEFFNNEGKKMFTDSTRDWTTNLSTYIKDVNLLINSQLDIHVKQTAQKSIAQLNDDKLQATKKQQGSDNNLRALDTASRSLDNLKRSLQTVN
jgi:hypothetical protein